MPTRRETTATPAKRTRALTKSVATRRRVMDAAVTLLVRQGYNGTRLSDIADEAGLQAGSLYYYFSSKEELIEEVLDYGIRLADEHVRNAVAAVGADAAPIERLDAAVTSFLDTTLEIGPLSPAYLRSYRELPEDIRERLRPGVVAASEFWGELVSAAVRSGELREDVDPFILQLFIIHTSEQVASWPTQSKSDPQAVSATVRMLIMDGIRTQR